MKNLIPAIYKYIKRGCIKSIQRGSITVTTPDTTDTATISAVDTDKTNLCFLGKTPSAAANEESEEVMIQLTNSTTVTATRITNDGETTVSYEVVEYY